MLDSRGAWNVQVNSCIIVACCCSVLWLMLWLFLCVSDRGEIDTLKKSLKESADEVQQLQKQLAEVNRANHTEIVKLQLEVR